MGLMSKLATGGLRKKWADYEAQTLANAMGLRLASGDPAFNFVVDPGHDSNDASSSRLGRRIERDIHLEGKWQSRPVEIVWATSAKKHFGVFVNTIRTDIDARMSAATEHPIESFEIVNKYAIGVLGPDPWLELPSNEFGNSAVDDVFELKCESADLGPQLAPIVEALLPVQWLHVVGGQNIISNVMTHFSVAGAVMQTRPLLNGLVAMAEIMDKRATS
jgi:hypothetical protein